MLCKVNVEIWLTNFVSPVMSLWQQRASHVGWCPNVRPGSLLTPRNSRASDWSPAATAGLWLAGGDLGWPGGARVKSKHWTQLRVAQWSHSGGQFESRLILRHWVVQHKQNIELCWGCENTTYTNTSALASAHRQPYKVSERRYH